MSLQLSAHKKGVGSTEDGRDSGSKRLGAKRADGQFVLASSILYRQRGTKIHPGINVGCDGGDTLFATVDDIVRFKRKGRDKKQVSVYPGTVNEQLEHWKASYPQRMGPFLLDYDISEGLWRNMFADSAKIFIKLGKGGDDHVSFRRELYVPCGGPNGGDGGKGGDIIFEVDGGLSTLTDFRQIRKYVAKDDEPGDKKRIHGTNSADLVIKVPGGTVIKDFETGQVIADMSGDNRRETILNGGRGGLGNMNFATPTMQAPKYVQSGQSGRGLWVQLELKAIADMGLVGFPNIGKSTLLSRVSSVKPKTASYYFTTLNPHLGVVDSDDGAGFIMVDISRLIEGAPQDMGLRHDFLRHIERTKVLIHVVDAASTEGRDPIVDIQAINAELEAYNPELLTRPQVAVANKIGAIYEGDENPVDKIAAVFEPGDIKVYPISAVNDKGVKELLYTAYELLKAIDQAPVIFERRFDMSSLNMAELPYTMGRNEDGEFMMEGPRIEKMLGYTSLESEEGFVFFQSFLKASGILEGLEQASIEEGDTVCMYGFTFDYYK